MKREPSKLESVLEDLEHARHLLSRAEFFFEMVETIEGDDREDRILALAEAGNRLLTEALEHFDDGLRAVGGRWR